MPVQIRDLKRGIAAVLLLAAASTLISCASQREQVALVKDPDAKPDSQIPWNKQEKWEAGGGQFGAMTDRR
jgi:hypothetical protein